VPINDNGTLHDLRFHRWPSIYAILLVNRSRDLAKLRQAYELRFVSTAEMMPPNCDVRFILDSGLSERNVNPHSQVGLEILSHVQAGLLKRSNGFSD
jgi:hypothetical protein